MICKNIKIRAAFKTEDGKKHTEVFNPHWSTPCIKLSELPKIIMEDILDPLIKKHKLQYPDIKITITFGAENIKLAYI